MSCRSRSSLYNDLSSSKKIPSLYTLCLIRARELRPRLQGISLLPEPIIDSIVSGCTAEELQHLEKTNQDLAVLPIWDKFWHPLCQKTMTPTITKAKPSDMSWREYYIANKRKNDERLREAALHCRNRLTTQQAKRAETLVLQSTPSQVPIKKRLRCPGSLQRHPKEDQLVGESWMEVPSQEEKHCSAAEFKRRRLEKREERLQRMLQHNGVKVISGTSDIKKKAVLEEFFKEIDSIGSTCTKPLGQNDNLNCIPKINENITNVSSYIYQHKDILVKRSKPKPRTGYSLKNSEYTPDVLATTYGLQSKKDIEISWSERSPPLIEADNERLRGLRELFYFSYHSSEKNDVQNNSLMAHNPVTTQSAHTEEDLVESNTDSQSFNLNNPLLPINSPPPICKDDKLITMQGQEHTTPSVKMKTVSIPNNLLVSCQPTPLPLLSEYDDDTDTVDVESGAPSPTSSSSVFPIEDTVSANIVQSHSMSEQSQSYPSFITSTPPGLTGKQFKKECYTLFETLLGQLQQIRTVCDAYEAQQTLLNEMRIDKVALLERVKAKRKEHKSRLKEKTTTQLSSSRFIEKTVIPPTLTTINEESISNLPKPLSIGIDQHLTLNSQLSETKKNKTHNESMIPNNVHQISSTQLNSVTATSINPNSTCDLEQKQSTQSSTNIIELERKKSELLGRLQLLENQLRSSY